MVIPYVFKLEGIVATHNLINQAYNNYGHDDIELTYKELSDKYIWQNIYNNTKNSVKSLEICRLTNGSIQLPVGVLTSLNIPTRP